MSDTHNQASDDISVDLPPLAIKLVEVKAGYARIDVHKKGSPGQVIWVSTDDEITIDYTADVTKVIRSYANDARIDELNRVAATNALTTNDHDHNLIAVHLRERKAELESSNE